MEIQENFSVYPYGKICDVRTGEIDPESVDKVTVYLLPEIFKTISLSSLEGYLIVRKDKFVDPKGFRHEFSGLIPRYTFPRSHMPKLEEQWDASFLPFEKRYDLEESRKPAKAKELLNNILRDFQ